MAGLLGRGVARGGRSDAGGGSGFEKVSAFHGVSRMALAVGPAEPLGVGGGAVEEVGGLEGLELACEGGVAGACEQAGLIGFGHGLKVRAASMA